MFKKKKKLMPEKAGIEIKLTPVSFTFPVDSVGDEKWAKLQEVFTMGEMCLHTGFDGIGNYLHATVMTLDKSKADKALEILGVKHS